MLKKEKATLPPARFESNSLRVLLEDIRTTMIKESRQSIEDLINSTAEYARKQAPEQAPKQDPKTTPTRNVSAARGGGFGSVAAPEQPSVGYGAKGGEGLVPLSPEGAFLSSGLGLAAIRTGLGMQQVDFIASKDPTGWGQIALATGIGSAVPAMFGGDEPNEVGDVEFESSFKGMAPSPTAATTRTVKFGRKEMSVPKDSFKLKLADPYGVGKFVDWAKGKQQPPNLDKGRKPPWAKPDV